jgi:hypothetical protein
MKLFKKEELKMDMDKLINEASVNKDWDDMSEYFKNKSVPEHLAKSITKPEKAAKLSNIASLMGWIECAKMMHHRAIELGMTEKEIAKIGRDTELAAWAAKFERAKKSSTWNVMVDDNIHKETKGIGIVTQKGPVTIKKCQEIMANVKSRFGFTPEKIKIFMWDFDYSGIDWDTYISAMCGDCSIPMTQEKTAVYDSKKNRLTIYDKSRPVYCNDDGHICNDVDALADSLD